MFGSLWDDFLDHVNEYVEEIEADMLSELTGAAREKACGIIESAWEYREESQVED